MAEPAANETRIFDLITARLPALVAYVDRTLHYRFCNRAYETFFGRGPGELDGKPVREGMGSSVFARAKSEIDRVLDGQRAQFDITLPSETDRERTLQVEYLPDFEPGTQHVRGYVIVAHDITIRKHAERALLERTKSFRIITETIPSGIWRCDPDGSADYASQRFADMVGYRVDELLGWGWAGHIHPDDQARVLQEWQVARGAGGAIVIEFRVKTADGTYRWFTSQGNPFRDETGTIIKYYGTWTDIDEQKRIAIENVELLQRERAAVRARDEFLSVVSHELKTPLTSLKLQSQLLRHLRDKGDPRAYAPERVDALIEQVDRQVNRLTRLVDDMLDISRIQTGRLHMHAGSIELEDLLSSAIDLVRAQFNAARTHGLQLIRAPKVRLEGDGARLQQVVSSLLANALRFGENRPVSVSAEVDGLDVVIRVRDEGRGIPVEMRERIFERFESAVSNEGGGLGLGLYIAKEIVVAHAGTIWVESEPGSGATFYVRLPIATDEPS